MYKFTQLIAGDFYIHVSKVTSGQKHKKIFLTEASTLNQDTANLYIKGNFNISCENNIDETYFQGSCSLDKNIAFKPGLVVTETALTDGLRVCVSAVSGKWSRSLLDKDFTAIAGEVIVPLSGEILIEGTRYSTTEVIVIETDKKVSVSGRVFVARKELQVQ